ncbi:MAG: BTAD domain-containing putative transcriptional regulator, partial [Trueperaceae bacterium]
EPVVHDGSPAPLGATLDDALLVVLAVHGGAVARTWLAGLFWPDSTESRARANLRWRLHRVRERPYAAAITADRATVRWAVACDVRALLRARDVLDDAEVLRLARGPFLGDARFACGPAFDAWCSEIRRDAADAWRDATRRAAATAEREGRSGDAADLLARLLNHDPLDETLLRAYLAAAFTDGRRDEALGRYAAFVERLRAELELEPLAETRQLVSDARDADASGFRRSTPRPAPSRAEPVPPAPNTTFVGREVELGRLASWLFDGPDRWLTVTGPGGIGKTRLVAEAVRSTDVALPGAVRFVTIRDTDASHDVAREVGRALDPGTEGDGDPYAWAQRAVMGARGVLVLDGIERVQRDLGWLHDALATAPDLRIVATSRLRPRRTDVRVLALGGLRTPDPEAVDPHGSYHRPPGRTPVFGPTDDGAPDDGALRLFEAVADRVAGPFEPDDATWVVVARICKRLDGVPLAIELAAAWTRTLAPEEIETELARTDHALFRRGPEANEHRHADLDRIFAATWALLPDPTRATLEALSVFHGGFVRDAAAEVAGADLASLNDLIDASLLHRTERRFRLLEPARRYAERRLDRDPKRARAARDAHARWAGRLAATASAHAAGADGRQATRVLLPDVDNLRAAWVRAVAHDDAQVVATLSHAVSDLWDLLGRYEEATALFRDAERVLRPTGSDADPVPYAWAMVRSAWFAFQSGRYDAVTAPARDAYERFVAASELRGAGTAAYVRAVTAAATGDVHEARRGFEAAMAHHRAADDPAGVARSESGLGQLERTTGRPDRARDLLQASLRTRLATGDDRGVVAVSGELAAVQAMLGDLDDAERTVRQGLHRARQHGDAWGEATLLHHRAAVAAARGERAAAERDFLRAMARLDRAGHRYAATLPREGLGDLWEEAKPRQALRLWSEALRTAMDIGAAPRILSMLARLGEMRAKESPDQAVAWLQVAVDHPSVPFRARDRAGVGLERARTRMAPDRFELATARGRRSTLHDVADAAWHWAQAAGGT